MLRASILAVLVRSPLLVVGLLAMIVGFHIWGAPGFWLALTAFLFFNVLIGRLESMRREREELRAMIDRGELR